MKKMGQHEFTKMSLCAVLDIANKQAKLTIVLSLVCKWVGMGGGAFHLCSRD